MNWFRRRRLREPGSWFRRSWWEFEQRLPRRRWYIEGSVEQADDGPGVIPPRRAFLVGNRRHRKWLVFDCPCDSGHRIMLNLDRRRRPFWILRASRRRRITVSPSVAYRGRDRCCHYALSNGRVLWLRPSAIRSDRRVK